MHYVVVSDKDVMVDYLGVFEADVEREFTKGEAEWFRSSKGVPLINGNVPEGVTVTVVVKE